MAEGSYYSRRSARDPDWREAQIREAGERELRRREADAEGFRCARRQVSRRHRERHAAHGLTFYELWLRVGGERHSLELVLRDELRRGRVDYHSSSRRYSVNGGVSPELRAALLELEPPAVEDGTDAAPLPPPGIPGVTQAPTNTHKRPVSPLTSDSGTALKGG